MTGTGTTARCTGTGHSCGTTDDGMGEFMGEFVDVAVGVEVPAQQGLVADPISTLLFGGTQDAGHHVGADIGFRR